MSVQFGRWSFDGQPPAADYIETVSKTLAPYGPDSNASYSMGALSILYRSFHTTKESRSEVQPLVCPSGAVLTWDGRLDNRDDLISELRDSLNHDSTDVAIVGAVYEKWRTNCLERLIGDWALSIWNPRERSVLLAKDPIGTKHLYYSLNDKQLTWSTILDPLLLFAGRTFEICEEYIAGWFSYFPAAHLTPYVGINSVPPSSSVLIHNGKHTVSKYWDFDPDKKVRYRTDAEYEEHFRTLFAQAVQRRLRSDRPVLAELSGGMDSSSIVCMADTVIANGTAETPRLDTISWYDDTHDHIEPDTNELHWVTKVEEKRGRTGLHIDLSSLKRNTRLHNSFESAFNDNFLAVTPSSNGKLSEQFKQYAAHMRSEGHRVTLSGIGGDEVTAGDVPTPIPELQDLLARARLFTLGRQLNAWASKMRKPRLPLLWKAAWGFFSRSLTGVPIDMHPAPWLHPGFVRRNRRALDGYPSRLKLFGPLPSFQENVAVLSVLRRFLENWPLQVEMLCEVRFPYLDRDFMEFLYAVPRGQIVGVGKRRFLMKRALVGIVPDELINRRRKAQVQQESTQESLKESSPAWLSLAELRQRTASSSMKFIDPDRFWEALQKAQHNQGIFIGCLMRTLRLEFWLGHLAIQGVLANPTSAKRERHTSLEGKELQAAVLPKSSPPRKPYTSISTKEGGENHEIRNSRTDGVSPCDQRHSGN
jgi:asparagine synthase (glutamine-hydrolysing)